MATEAQTQVRPLQRSRRLPIGDTVFRLLVIGCGLSIFIVAAALCIVLAEKAMPAFEAFGFGFITSQEWDPVSEVFGALPTIFGTIASALIALFFAVPIAIGAAIFLSEMAPPWLRAPASYLIETLAAIPSVIYGLWALFILVPIIRDPIEVFLVEYLSWIPIFDGPQFGVGLLAAGIILAIMILPIVTAVSRDIMLAVPNSQREAMLALGATEWETISRAVLPYARSGIIGAVILGLGRALGETIAVTMVIGNSFNIPESVLHPSNTIASAIASQFAEASPGVFIASLVYLALILFAISLIINVTARMLVSRLVNVSGPVRE